MKENGCNPWDNLIKNAVPIESNLPDIPEDKEFEEMLEQYTDKLYRIKNDLEFLISDISYFDDSRSEKSFEKELAELQKAYKTLEDLWES